MNPLASVRDYWRISAGVRDYARQPVPTNPIELIRRQVGEREDAWLSLVRRSIFNFANSPYRRMFELAGCTLGDLESSVRGRGIEATLEELYDGGVYLTYDEFKGRLPIVRSGHEIESTASSFHNRHDAVWLDASTSGSSGQPTRVPQDTGAAPLRDAVGGLAIKEFDLHNHKRMMVRPTLPSSIGVLLGLSMSRLGCPMHQWYATGGSGRDSLHYRLLTQYLTYASRLSGATVPAPEYLRQGDFATPTEWIARQKDAGMPSMVSAFVSPAVRMAVLAKERGWDIGDSIFFTGGEALTLIRKVYLPAAMPTLFTGFRLAVGRAMVVTISVEMVSSNKGLGGMIWLSWQSFAVEKMFVSVAIAGLMGAFFHVLLRWLEKRVIPWRAASAG
jgi:hypothetical protein